MKKEKISSGQEVELPEGPVQTPVPIASKQTANSSNNNTSAISFSPLSQIQSRLARKSNFYVDGASTKQQTKIAAIDLQIKHTELVTTIAQIKQLQSSSKQETEIKYYQKKLEQLERERQSSAEELKKMFNIDVNDEDDEMNDSAFQSKLKPKTAEPQQPPTQQPPTQQPQPNLNSASRPVSVPLDSQTDLDWSKLDVPGMNDSAFFSAVISTTKQIVSLITKMKEVDMITFSPNQADAESTDVSNKASSNILEGETLNQNKKKKKQNKSKHKAY